MQKVESSSLFIRFEEKPRLRGFSVVRTGVRNLPVQPKLQPRSWRRLGLAHPLELHATVENAGRSREP